MPADFKYAAPVHVTNLEECVFYHHMDLPGLGEVGKGWDLRSTIDDYLGHFDFRNKRVLDVGTASGYLTFEIEKRGATEVVSFDMSDQAGWELVPFAIRGFDIAGARERMQSMAESRRKAYWLAHRLLNSRARVHYGDIYNFPEAIGQFDVVMLGMVLPHLRNPFHALAQTAQLSRDAIIITQQAPRDTKATAYFIPTAQMDPANIQAYVAWWVFSNGCLTEMLAVLGFRIESLAWTSHMCTARTPPAPEECLTIVARR